MIKPVFSVIIVCYNSENFIKDTILSCLNQTFKEYEIIISDDNSTDNTWDIVKGFTDSRIKAFKQDINLGEYSNRNFCIKKAAGDFIIFIDGEDLLYTHALSFLLPYIQKYPDASQFIAREWDERIVYPKLIAPAQFAGIEYLDKGIIALNFTRILFSRKALINTEAFDKSQVKIGDVYIQYKIGLSGKSVIIPEGFSWWRRRKGQASEKIIRDLYQSLGQLNKFKIQLLIESGLLNVEDLKVACNNFYGAILRFLFRELLKFNFIKVYNFLKLNPVPFKYYPSFFTRPVFSFLKKFNGENPFKD